MRISKKARTLLGALTGAAAVAVAGAVVDAGAASAKARGGVLRVIDVSVAGLDFVPQNSVIKLTFSSDIDPATVSPAVFQVRERNASGTGFTKQVPGSFQVVGNVVHFYPRLPTHLRDPLSATGDFYNVGTPRDNAVENAGLKASTSYQVLVIGGSTPDALRSLKGRKLNRSYTARFSTTPNTPAKFAFTTDTYGDLPPPGFQYSNPSDKVASAFDQYAIHGGTRDVPNAISVTLFGNRVPLSPATLRQGSNVTLQMTERNGDPSAAKPIRGTPFVEQNFDGVRVVFKPLFPLPDRGTYALRLTKDVKDLTEQFDFRNNPERFRLREIFEFMLTAEQLSPGTPASDLPDPPIELIFDWPTDAAARGVLKTNVLALGKAYPYEVDPRVMVLFSTRDEPVSNGEVILEFERTDNLVDTANSTADYDEGVPGAASAILTIAGGSGVNGDYLPSSNETIDVDLYPNRTLNWRKVRIPPGVVVTLKGTRPAMVKCFSIELDGEIRADGGPGNKSTHTSSNYTYSPSQLPITAPGIGGPGGGPGGASTRNFYSSSTQTTNGYGENGAQGVDENGVAPGQGEAGMGGNAGYMTPGAATTTIPYCNGSGGGGGGARVAGTNGATTTPPVYNPPWSATGGTGGAGSSNDDLSPLVGGAGGGAGGNGQYYPIYYPIQYGTYYYLAPAGSGGGGGGALLVQTAGVFTIGSSGAVRARGGQGGNGLVAQTTGVAGGPGGGGGGGSILLRTTKGFNITNPGAATDVRGGAGGTNSGATYGAPSGGTGGAGYVRTEDSNGGNAGIPSASGGYYDPIGGGVPSVVYTKWIDLGVDSPRMVNFTQNDFIVGAGGNDAVLIEMQMTIEDVDAFGSPDLSSITAQNNSSDTAVASQWAPVRIVDLTGTPGGAFGAVPGYDSAIHGQDYIFPITPLNGRNYKFFRVRITFQLDETQTSRDPFPFLDRLVVNFQFNI